MLQLVSQHSWIKVDYEFEIDQIVPLFLSLTSEHLVNLETLFILY